MKHTKSMYYNPTEEARELFLYTTNNAILYNQVQCIINNLTKKAKKGIYNSEKAIDLYYYLATEASNKYYKDFGYKFSVTDRYTVAVELEAYYKDDEVFYNLNN